MKKLFLITSILMLVLALSSVCFAERESTSGRVSNASGKSEYMEEEEETTTSRGTSYGTRPSTGSTVSRPSTTTTSRAASCAWRRRTGTDTPTASAGAMTI